MRRSFCGCALAETAQEFLSHLFSAIGRIGNQLLPFRVNDEVEDFEGDLTQEIRDALSRDCIGQPFVAYATKGCRCNFMLRWGSQNWAGKIFAKMSDFLLY